MTRDQAHSLLDLIRDGVGTDISLARVNEALTVLGDGTGASRPLFAHPMQAKAKARRDRAVAAAFDDPHIREAM